MSRCVRQWRNLKDIKRGGAGNTSVPIDDLGDGTLAVECPACPQPGRNLPPEWENESQDRAYVPPLGLCCNTLTFHCRWLYSLFIAMDANFRLKLKTRGIKDPELGSGLAYFVNATKLEAHLKNYVDEREVSFPVPFVRQKIYILRDRDLWDGVSCGKPGKLEAVERFYCVRRGCSGLSTWPHPQEWSR